MFAMFGLALVPAISHALRGSGPGNPWAEICSVASGKRAADSGASGSQAPNAGIHMEHCPLCSLGASPMAPPPAVALTAVPEGAVVVHTQRAEAPGVAWVWTGAQPRGPPVFLLN